MEAGDSLEVTVDLKIMNKNNKSNSTYWKAKCEEIVQGVCALLNSFGGKLRIDIGNQDVTRSQEFEDVLDKLLRAIGQRLLLFIPLVLFNRLVKMPKLQDKKFVYEISLLADKLFTMKYNLYIPTLKQVEEIPPHQPNALEKIKEICNTSTKLAKDDIQSRLSGFIVDKSVQLTESDRLQFKHVSDKKCADRIVDKGNKLKKTVSAFANHCGGHLLIGISNDGIVHGQHLSENEKGNVEAKVTKALNHLIWIEQTMLKGDHWNIEFIPVEDDKNNVIDSLFIIKIWIKALPGGVFVEEPKSYHIGLNSEVRPMSFDHWKSRIIFGVRPVLASVNRIEWSSPTAQRKYFKVIFELNDLQNDAKYKMFEKIAKAVKKQHRGTATELFVMIIESVVAYKRGMMTTADEILGKIEATLKDREDIDDHEILKFRMLYAKSAIARAKGDYESSYEYAIDAHQVAEQIPTGVLTAWFFNHVAIVEKFLSQQQLLEQENKDMEKSSLNHYVKALQYAKSSNVEQEFTGMIADLEQRVHIFRAICILGNFAKGAKLSEVTSSNIKAAENDLLRYKELEIAGFLPSNYRRTYFLFAKSDLRFAQWYLKLRNQQLHQQQLRQQEQQQNQQQQQEGDYKTCSLLKEAHSKAIEARNLSKRCGFEELTQYANCRIGRIAEMMVKFNFVSTHSKRRSEISATH